MPTYLILRYKTSVFPLELEQLAKYLGSGNKVTINTQHISSVYEES